MPSRSAYVAALLIACGVVVFGQAQREPRRFDVASVKRNTSGLPGYTTNDGAGGRYVAVNTSPRGLLRFAFNELATEFVGVPEWAGRSTFDVTATVGGEASLSDVREMVRYLLVDRFNLRFHIETQSRPAYALVLARDEQRLGPNIHRVNADCSELAAAGERGERIPASANGAPTCGFLESNGVMRSGGIAMPTVAQFLRSPAGRMVIDRTGLSGEYAFTLTYAVDPSQPSEAASIFSAVEEQLGLKLEAVVTSVPVLVVERLELPDPN